MLGVWVATRPYYCQWRALLAKPVKLSLKKDEAESVCVEPTNKGNRALNISHERNNNLCVPARCMFLKMI